MVGVKLFFLPTELYNIIKYENNNMKGRRRKRRVNIIMYSTHYNK